MLIRALPVFLMALGVYGASEAPKQIDISGSQQWTDTGIDVHPGETVKITATGAVHFPAAKENGPEGLPRAWLDLLRVFPVKDAGRGALIGRIGESAAARPFLIGPRAQAKVVVDGRLFLGINTPEGETAEGSFHVTIERAAASATLTKVSADIQASLPKFTQAMLDELPARVNDQAGDPGDRVNFLIIGSQTRMQSALQAAGWILPDRSIRDTILHGALESLSKEGYTTLPMSVLYLFNRPQDFGYAQADPLRVVASRHHFRIWKAQFDVDGVPLWAGAGTHDIGIEKDQRNGKLTHKIDPNVDDERDYIGQSLQQTGLVAKLEYLTPTNPLREAKTATGGGFHSDGRTLVIYLAPDTLDFSRQFADLFCSVFKQENPDTGEWGDCGQYLDAPGKDDLKLAPLPAKYRLLIVPGILSSCASDAPAFQEGQKWLREKYGMTVDLFNAPNDSSEQNAQKIATYLRDETKKDARKFIVLGYSKGTPDLQVALATEDGVAADVAGFITVAGASGGSPIADSLPGQVDGWVRKFQIGKCEGDLSTGFKSLRRDVRQAFLTSYPDPIVPTYSLVAISDKTNTSKGLLEAQRLLSVFDLNNDAQLTKSDAIVPGAKFLGAARADHLAVALPFDKMGDQEIRKVMDHARYPRAALLEALVRFVVADLESGK
ncbi:MAG TPA: LssY C-terminal domain-containing protein [Bryobacteraceae bacterium]|nr:LssY C-terminal domain-containing protein [Bryobacteraceae bacterium]